MLGWFKRGLLQVLDRGIVVCENLTFSLQPPGPDTGHSCSWSMEKIEDEIFQSEVLWTQLPLNKLCVTMALAWWIEITHFLGCSCCQLEPCLEERNQTMPKAFHLTSWLPTHPGSSQSSEGGHGLMMIQTPTVHLLHLVMMMRRSASSAF